MNALKTDKFYIDGRWVKPSTDNVIDVINPATEAPLTTIAMGAKQDVDRAVEAAKRAFPHFSQSKVEARVALLKRIKLIYERRYEEMSQTMSQELGAPITLCREAQSKVGIGHLDATITVLESFAFEEKNSEGDLILREPIGVCGMITPWNWPINQIALKVFPALAAGCTIVLKPSEVTPLNALLFMEILDEAGVPKGVVNVINGDGPSVGTALSQHPDVNMISFTGSTRAGTQITKDAADTVKRLTLELGGKSPNIILPDADLRDAISRNLRHCFANSGQSCNSPTRMLVHRSQYQSAMDVVRTLAPYHTVGMPNEEGDHIGPLVSKVQFDRVQALIRKGIDEGATVLMGGLGKPDGFDLGYFVKPTVFGNAHNKMAIAQEEIFGPVLVVIPYESEEEAIQIANDSPYGLAAYIQCADENRAMDIMRKLRAGMVRINGSDIGYASPFGGYKLSGNGREGGAFGIEDYCEVKAVSVPKS